MGTICIEYANQDISSKGETGQFEACAESLSAWMNPIRIYFIKKEAS